MEVSKNIRAIRERKNLTQVEVAAKLGTERSNYARLENRDQNLTVKQISEIAVALEVSIFEIIGLPEGSDLNQEQSEKVRSLEEKLATTEEILKDKRRNIRLYKSFIEWTRDKYKEQFVIAALHTAQKLELRTLDFNGDRERGLTIEEFNFTESELKQIGDEMLSFGATDYFLNDFIAASGFITDKWFIDAYKRVCRKRKEKVAFAEVKNWVNGVFEFLEDE